MMSGVGGMSSMGMASMGRMPSMEQMSRMRDQAFARADADGSTALDGAEFGKLMEQNPMGRLAGMGGPSGAQASEVFTRLDTDGDGSLTRGELDAGMKATIEKFGASGSSAMSSGAEPAGPAESASATTQQLLQKLIQQLSQTYDSNAGAARVSLQA